MSDIEKNREEIKSQVPKLYDHYWHFLDDNNYFDFNTSSTNFHPLKIEPQILVSGSSALVQAYHDLISNICFSLAANKLANEIEVVSLGNYFRFNVRNPHTKLSIHNFHRFLDHSVFHLNELSLGHMLGSNPRCVSFKKLQKTQNISDGINAEIISGKDILLQKAFSTLTDRGKEILRKFRDVDEHRFPLGIDCIFYPFSRGNVEIRIDDRNGRLFTIGNPEGDCYNFYGAPDFKFTELEPILAILGNNAKIIMHTFCQNGLLAFKEK